MKVFLVRHAKAGDRTTWEGDDRQRPLTSRGRRQAELLRDLLVAEDFASIVSSPYVRCLQTVVPLACAREMSIEASTDLAEGATLDAAYAVVRKYAYDGAVLCTHGDVVPMIVTHLRARGVPIHGPADWAKGSMWVLDFRAGEPVAARYVAPPADAEA